jgi:hypothetical protein
MTHQETTPLQKVFLWFQTRAGAGVHSPEGIVQSGIVPLLQIVPMLQIVTLLRRGRDLGLK